MQAMILAAGYGVRLRPYTELLPKPLFPVCNQPLLLRIIAQLQTAGCRRLVVNAHHLAGAIETAVCQIPGVQVQREEEILGTGGGLGRARRHFDAGAVLVTNGDIFHTIDYRAVLDCFVSLQPAALLVLHDYPRFNKVAVDTNARVRAFSGTCREGKRLLAFTGVHVLARRLLDLLPESGYADVIDLYRQLIDSGERVIAMEVTNHYWRDIGTPADYLALHDDIFRLPAMRAVFDIAPGRRLVRGVGAELCGEVTVPDWAVVGEGARIGRNVLLSRTVVWPGRMVADHTAIHDRIVS